MTKVSKIILMASLLKNLFILEQDSIIWNCEFHFKTFRSFKVASVKSSLDRVRGHNEASVIKYITTF